jgi:hypothetical protein
VEEIAMKKPKMVPDLFAVTDVCIEASEAWAQLLESRGNVTSSKKEDRDVNIADPAIASTEETADIAASNPRSKKRRGVLRITFVGSTSAHPTVD